jgi:hypothetical protein
MGFVSGDGLIKLPFALSENRMNSGDKAHWLQILILLIVVTASVCNAATPNERRWEKADLIVEGKITETANLNGNIVSTVTVDRVLKTGHLELTYFYSKGYVNDLTFQIQASNLPTGQPQRIFLEETQTGYRIIASEKIKEQKPELIDPGVSGLLLLITVTVIASQRSIGENRIEGYS